MAPYWGLLAFTGILGFLLCELKQSRKRDFVFLAAIAVVMVAMAALRAPSVGVDTQPYLNTFKYISGAETFSDFWVRSGAYRKEPGYSLLNFIVAHFTKDPIVFMGIVSALIITLRLIFLYFYSPSVWISGFVYISFGFFGYAMCTLRQELAISIMMFALPLIQKKKIVPYMLICAVAATFHMSLWIMIPVYFIAQLPVNKIMLGIYSAGTLGILLFSEKFLDFITQYVFKAYKPGTYYTLGRNYSTAVFPVLVFILAMLLFKKLVERNPRNTIWINLSCYAALLFILTLKNFIFQRVALVFLPVALLLIPELVLAVRPNGEKLEELARYQAMDKARQKQHKDKIASLKIEHKNEMALYYTSMGLVLAGCAIYFLFLLSANRLLLVPYVLR